jgi:hypothetical protein
VADPQVPVYVEQKQSKRVVELSKPCVGTIMGRAFLLLLVARMHCLGLGVRIMFALFADQHGGSWATVTKLIHCSEFKWFELRHG